MSTKSLDNPYFFCLFVSIVQKILLLNIKQTIFKSNLAIVVFFEAFSCCTLYLSCPRHGEQGSVPSGLSFNIIDKHTQLKEDLQQ
jgi:hypothetical protein